MISTAVRWRTCGCGQRVLVAIAEGAPVAVDPAVVDPLAEVAGLIAGRFSYDLVKIYGRSELVHRSYSRMGHRRYPVVLTHPCAKAPVADDPAESWKKKQGGKEPGPRTGTPVAVKPPF